MSSGSAAVQPCLPAWMLGQYFSHFKRASSTPQAGWATLKPHRSRRIMMQTYQAGSNKFLKPHYGAKRARTTMPILRHSKRIPTKNCTSCALCRATQKKHIAPNRGKAGELDFDLRCGLLHNATSELKVAQERISGTRGSRACG